MLLLILVAVSIIDSFNALNGMAEDALRDMGENARAAHERSSCPAQIVKGPVRVAKLGLQIEQGIEEAAAMASSAAREDVRDWMRSAAGA